MGEILFRSGAMEAVFNSLDRLVGRIRGRQYVLCILLSAILGALSGAAMAVAGLLGRSLLPEMLRRGYNTRLSAGTILAGACLDPIIPPSVLAILIATLAEISTAGLLIAGIIPGLLLMCLFLIYVMYPGVARSFACARRRVGHGRRKAKDQRGRRHPSHPSLRLRVLHGHGPDHVRRGDADRSGRHRRVRRDRRRDHLPQVFRADDRAVAHHGRNGFGAAAGHHVLRGDVQPVADVHRRDARGRGSWSRISICPPWSCCSR